MPTGFFLFLVYRIRNGFSDKVNGYDRDGKYDDKQPFCCIQTMAVEDFAAYVGHYYLNDYNKSHNLEIVLIFRDMLKYIEFFGSDVEGVEYGYEDEESKICGHEIEPFAFFTRSISDEVPNGACCPHL